MTDFADWPRDAGAASPRAFSREQVLCGLGASGCSHAVPWKPLHPMAESPAADYIVDFEASEDPPRRFLTLQAAVDME